MGLDDRDYIREGDDRGGDHLRPEIPWHSASRMSDDEYKQWLFQKVERPWLAIVVGTMLGVLLIWLTGDEVMRSFVDTLLGR